MGSTLNVTFGIMCQFVFVLVVTQVIRSRAVIQLLHRLRIRFLKTHATPHLADQTQDAIMEFALVYLNIKVILTLVADLNVS